MFRTVGMCVHEHYGEGNICAGCLSDMRKFCDDDGWECQVCGEGPAAHACPMPVTVTELERAP